MNECIEKLLSENPLIKFSVYTHIQVEILKELSDEIFNLLEISIGEGVIRPEISKVYGKFWLWILGAYEVVRTMDEAQECFTDELRREFNELKSEIAVIRMPFAKQQIRGRRKVISNDASYSVDEVEKDVVFLIDGQRISIRKSIENYQAVFLKVSSSDVLKDLRKS